MADRGHVAPVEVYVAEYAAMSWVQRVAFRAGYQDQRFGLAAQRAHRWWALGRSYTLGYRAAIAGMPQPEPE